jgi:signal transduction histidine kinase
VSEYLDELVAYVGFDEGDHQRLRALHPVLAPKFPEIAERFYAAVWASPGAAAVLSGPEQVDRLRGTLIDWMASGLLGPYDDRFYDKRSRIGRRHVAIGLSHQYMFAAMTIVRIAYHEHVAALCPLEDVPAIVRSVDKLLDIELAIMVHHYQLDMQEKLLARERRTQEDRLIAMQTMTAGLAHEVRNPLNAAKLQLELVERRLRRDAGNGLGSDDEMRLVRPCLLAKLEVERLEGLLNEFLVFARPPDLQLRQDDVVPIVRQVVELERLDAERRGATLDLVAPPQLVANVDAAKLHQIVLNLVRNAIEAVSRDGRVAVVVSGYPEHSEISVADDGPGIPEPIRARIYEPFFSTKPSGTGLGMSIVHSLVTHHGGTIDVDTSPRGTRFTVRIPR